MVRSIVRLAVRQVVNQYVRLPKRLARVPQHHAGRDAAALLARTIPSLSLHKKAQVEAANGARATKS